MREKRYGIGLLCGLGAQVLFGFSFLFSKSALNNASALSLLSWRFMIAFLVMSFCVRIGWIKTNFKEKSIRALFILAFLHPILYFIGETVGIQLTTASESGTIIAVIPIVTLVLSFLILHEKPHKRQICGIILAFAGVIIIVLMQSVSLSFNVVGYLMLFVAVYAYCFFSIYNKQQISYSVQEKTYIMLFTGMIFFTPAAIIEGILSNQLVQFFQLPFTNSTFLIAVLYLGIASSVIAFLLCNASISLIGPNGNASLAGLTTVITVIASVVFLKEPFSVWQFIGGVLILSGVYIANLEEIRKELADWRSSKSNNKQVLS